MTSRWPDDYFEKNIADRIKAVGHRQYVGGFSDQLWYEIGKLQYHFLVQQGLKPEHVFYDVACGSLRLGQYLIPYLNEGRYHGLDLDQTLIDIGIEKEFYTDIIALRNPRFFVNEEFDFGISPNFDFAIAQSLFTHLDPDDIRSCLSAMRGKCHAHSQFYFTVFLKEGRSPENPGGPSDPNKNWFYRKEDIEDFCETTGWYADFIGDWRHPANQMMFRARPAGR